MWYVYILVLAQLLVISFFLTKLTNHLTAKLTNCLTAKLTTAWPLSLWTAWSLSLWTAWPLSLWTAWPLSLWTAWPLSLWTAWPLSLWTAWPLSSKCLIPKLGLPNTPQTIWCPSIPWAVMMIWDHYKVNMSTHRYIYILPVQSPLHRAVHYKVNMYCMKKHKPLGPVAKSPFLSLSASV